MNSYPVMNLLGQGGQRRFTRPGASIYGAKCYRCPDGSYRMLSPFDAGQAANAGCQPTGQRQCPPPPAPTSVATPGAGTGFAGVAKCYTCPDGSKRMLNRFDAGQPQNAGCTEGCAPTPAPTPVATPGAGGGAPGVRCYECPDGSVSMMDSAAAAARGCIASNAPGCVPPVRPGVATPGAGTQASIYGVKCYTCPDGSQRMLSPFDAGQPQNAGCKEGCQPPARPDVASIDRYATARAPSQLPGYYGVAMPGGVFGLTGPMLPQVRLVRRPW